MAVAGDLGSVCKQSGVGLVLRAAEAWRWITGQGGRTEEEGELWRTTGREGDGRG